MRSGPVKQADPAAFFCLCRLLPAGDIALSGRGRARRGSDPCADGDYGAVLVCGAGAVDCVYRAAAGKPAVGAGRIALAVNSNKRDLYTKKIAATLLPDIRFVEVLGEGNGFPRKPQPDGALPTNVL